MAFSADLPVRPRRSVLYMPGSNERAMEKAKALAADALIFDLEDAVAPDIKLAAREAVCAMTVQGGYGRREVVIRTNGLDTEWGEADLDAVAAAAPDAILLPKITSGVEVVRVHERLEQRNTPAHVRLWAMMETPLAMLHAEDIAAAARSTRLDVFVMGTNDLAKDLHAHSTPSRLPLVTGLSLSLLAARAYGIDVIDGVHNAIQDEEGFVQSCQQGLEFGFDGKTLIHPSQIKPCNRVFSPDPEAVAWARRVITEFEKPENASKGALQIDGRMVERLHAEEARRLVALAEAIEAMEQA